MTFAIPSRPRAVARPHPARSPRDRSLLRVGREVVQFRPAAVGVHQQLPVPVADGQVRAPVLPRRGRRTTSSLRPYSQNSGRVAARGLPRRAGLRSSPSGRTRPAGPPRRGGRGSGTGRRPRARSSSFVTPGGDQARPPGDERHPDAPLVQAQLAPAEAAGPLPAERRQRAVVGEEQDERRPARCLLAEGSSSRPTCRSISTSTLASRCGVSSLAGRPAVLADLLVVGRRHPRRVRVVEPEVDEAGRLGLALEEVERPVDHPARPVPPLDLVVRRPDPVAGGDVRVGLGALPGAEAAVVAVGGELGRVATSRPPPRCHLPTWAVA